MRVFKLFVGDSVTVRDRVLILTASSPGGAVYISFGGIHRIRVTTDAFSQILPEIAVSVRQASARWARLVFDGDGPIVLGTGQQTLPLSDPGDGRPPAGVFRPEAKKRRSHDSH